MAIACPACGKAGQTEAACRRCGCDLSRLHAISEAAVSHLDAALAAFAAREWSEALSHAELSWRLRRARAAAEAAFLAAAASGDTRRALRWHERAILDRP